MSYIIYKQINDEIQSLNIEIQLFDKKRISLTKKEVAFNIININKKVVKIKNDYSEQKQELCKKISPHKCQILNILSLKEKGQIKNSDYRTLFDCELNSLKALGMIFSKEKEIEIEERKITISQILKQAQKEIIENLSEIERKINDIEIQERKINEKSILEKSYFSAAIFLASLPVLSGLGLAILYFYLDRIDSSIFFMDIAAEGGLSFTISLGLWFILTQLAIPYAIIFLPTEKDGKIQTFLILSLLLVLSVLFSWMGFWAIAYIQAAIFPTIIWHLIVFTIRYLYKNLVVKIHKYSMTIPFILTVPVTLIIITTLSLVVLNTNELSTGLRLENILRIGGFSQKDYSWFKVNNAYFERTGLNVGTLKAKEKEFSPQHKQIEKPDEGIILYGKLWVNSSKIKILCPPEPFKPSKNNEKTNQPLDISFNEVSKKCIQFQADDLQNLMGLTRE